MSQQAAAPIAGTQVGMSSMNSPNASVGVPTGAAAAPDTNPAGGGVKPVLGGMSLMRRMALMFGKDTEEQVKNINAFSSTVKDVGNTVSKMQESTLMQRMMEESMKGPSFLNPGASPAGGVGAIPKTFDPSLASHIVNQLGYK